MFESDGLTPDCFVTRLMVSWVQALAGAGSRLPAEETGREANSLAEIAKHLFSPLTGCAKTTVTVRR